MLWAWFVSHECKECDERFSPSLTHCNALSPVIFVVLVILVIATADSVQPRFVLCGWPSIEVRLTVLERMDIPAKLLKASTTFNLAVNKISATNYFFLPTVAFAQPYRVPFIRPGMAEDRKHSESLTDNCKLRFWHGVSYHTCGSLFCKVIAALREV